MKRTLFILLTLLLLYACKKDDTTSKENTSYITLNGDTRQLGVIPSTEITMTNAAFSNPDQWQLSLGIKKACHKIAGLNNGELEVYIDIWDKRLLKNEYPIIPYSKKEGTATLGIRPYKIGSSGLTWFEALGGKITITKNTAGRLTSVECANIPLSTYNGQSYTVSARFTVTE